MSSPSVYFGGSRHMAQSSTIWAACTLATNAGYQIHVGCCVGADAHIIQNSPVNGVQVFAAFGPGGQCSIPGLSAVATVINHPGRVWWWVGGGPSVPVRARLIRRSAAALRGCAFAVFFQPGAGSLAVAALAVKAGQPVFAFQPAQPAAVPGFAGQWQPATRFNLPHCWQWQPATTQPALF